MPQSAGSRWAKLQSNSHLPEVQATIRRRNLSRSDPGDARIGRPYSHYPHRWRRSGRGPRSLCGDRSQAQGGALETARAAGRKDNSLNMSEVLTRRLRDVFA